MMTIFYREIGETGDCGKFAAGIAYMIAYLTLRFLTIIIIVDYILDSVKQAC